MTSPTPRNLHPPATIAPARPMQAWAASLLTALALMGGWVLTQALGMPALPSASPTERPSAPASVPAQPSPSPETGIVVGYDPHTLTPISVYVLTPEPTETPRPLPATATIQAARTALAREQATATAKSEPPVCHDDLPSGSLCRKPTPTAIPPRTPTPFPACEFVEPDDLCEVDGAWRPTPTPLATVSGGS